MNNLIRLSLSQTKIKHRQYTPGAAFMANCIGIYIAGSVLAGPITLHINLHKPVCLHV